MQNQTISICDFGAVGNGTTDNTKAIQSALDYASQQVKSATPQESSIEVKACLVHFERYEAKPQITVEVPAGTYLTGPIFIGSYVRLYLHEGAELISNTDESKLPLIQTRIAGIEMEGYPALVNVIDAKHAEVCGKGAINGQGPYWWNKYWGEDTKGGMRKVYDSLGLRWCVDYDCLRMRNVLVYNSSHICLKDFTSKRSGFWNVQVTYSNNVLVEGLYICENRGPSTDGIDIDSSTQVEVCHCRVDCNDDCICVKSGRDSDGQRVNRESREVYIHNCEIQRGCGVTIGSEVSGSIYDVEVANLQYRDTDVGFRIKSAPTRGGTIERIMFRDCTMHNVRYVTHFNLNWHPDYSIAPQGTLESCPIKAKPHWNTLLTPVPKELGLTTVREIKIQNVVATCDRDQLSRGFEILGSLERPIQGLALNDCQFQVSEFGRLIGVEQLFLNNTTVSALHPNTPDLDTYDVR